MLSFTIITIFPEMFASPLGHSILKKAQEKGLIAVHLDGHAQTKSLLFTAA